MARRGGWRRVGGRRRFRYLDARGEPITAPRALDRIEALRIPPAWQDVWISPNAMAKLQATGVDAAGRRQYLYHPDFRAQREREKYERLVRFGERLPAFRERVAADVAGEPLTREWACAVAATLVNRTWFRVGSDRYTRTSRTYGVTTLTKRHACVQRDRVTFTFRAKHRKLVRTTLVDDELAEALGLLLDLPGGARLFRYVEAEGIAPAPVTGPVLNAYIGAHLAEGFTAKDFRTWGGTLTAAVALAERGAPPSETEARRGIAAAMRRVADELGNTPAVARASYVSPAVVEQYRDGRTLETFSRGRRRLSVAATGLAEEERALLSLLRSWRIRSSRAEAA